jgi:hypothetical protein
MIVETVSRKEIRSMRVGQVGIYTLPSKRAKDSVRVQFSKVKDLEEGKFDYESVKEDELRNSLGNDFDTVIPDWNLTLAFRCTKNDI